MTTDKQQILRKIAKGTAVAALGAAEAARIGTVGAGWLVAIFLLQTTAELCISPVSMSAARSAAMERWLRERLEPVPDADLRGHTMPGMDHPMLMPGMLTEAQLAQLDSARGPDFDRLFLTDMIQHHRGALAMVRALTDTPRAARDGPLFQVASDISADQTAEIDRMTRMLDAATHTPQRSPQ